MALDLTLCLLPQEAKLIFNKAELNPVYAESLSFIPSILQKGDWEDFGDEVLKAFKEEVLNLKQFYAFEPSDVFFDISRCTATLDYLIDEYFRSKNIKFKTDLLRNGGKKIGEQFTGAQGIPLRIYDRKEIEEIQPLIAKIRFSDLGSFYDYGRIKERDIYKLTPPDHLNVLEDALKAVQFIFKKAHEQSNLLVLKVVN